MHEETPTYCIHNSNWRQDDEVEDRSDRPKSTTGPARTFTDPYHYETSKILQITIFKFAELMVRLETECRKELYPVYISISHHLQFSQPRPARRTWRNYLCDKFTGDVLRCCEDADISMEDSPPAGFGGALFVAMLSTRSLRHIRRSHQS